MAAACGVRRAACGRALNSPAAGEPQRRRPPGPAGPTPGGSPDPPRSDGQRSTPEPGDRLRVASPARPPRPRSPQDAAVGRTSPFRRTRPEPAACASRLSTAFRLVEDVPALGLGVRAGTHPRSFRAAAGGHDRLVGHPRRIGLSSPEIPPPTFIVDGFALVDSLVPGHALVPQQSGRRPSAPYASVLRSRGQDPGSGDGERTQGQRHVGRLRPVLGAGERATDRWFIRATRSPTGGGFTRTIVTRSGFGFGSVVLASDRGAGPNRWRQKVTLGRLDGARWHS